MAGNEHVHVRVAAPVGPELRGRTFVGYIKHIVGFNDMIWAAPSGIDLYDNTSKDLLSPIATIGVGVGYGGFNAGGESYIIGIPLSNQFCFVSIDLDGKVNLMIEGVEFAAFDRVGDATNGAWRMRAKNSIGTDVPVILGPPDPFRGIDELVVMSSCEPIFAAAVEPAMVGNAYNVSRNWRAIYQACKSDDPHLENPPGLRSPWNYLSSNCCIDYHPGDPDEQQDIAIGAPNPCADGGGGGGGGNPCDQANLFCAAIVRICTNQNGFPVGRFWCMLQGQNHCEVETGNRCFCSHLFDVNGNPLPDPAVTPIGTVMAVKCVDKYDGNPQVDSWCSGTNATVHCS
jgi:hypothetical protein